MNGRILGIAAGLAVVVIAVLLMAAWIKGSEQPTRWIEQQPATAMGTAQ